MLVLINNLMSQTINILSPHDDDMYLKKKGVVDLQKFYADIKKWFEDHNFEFEETDHKIKTPSPLGTEEEIKINGWRNEHDFSKWWLKIEISIWDSMPVDVIKDGKPKRMYRCRIKVKMRPTFEVDYENRFEKSKFMRKMRDFYVGKILGEKIKIEGDKFEYEFHELHDLMKRDLDIDASGDQFEHMWKN